MNLAHHLLLRNLLGGQVQWRHQGRDCCLEAQCYRELVRVPHLGREDNHM